MKLTANLWVQAGLVNGAMGTVVAICYDQAGESPPNLPVEVTVRFDSYCGPTLPDVPSFHCVAHGCPQRSSVPDFSYP